MTTKELLETLNNCQFSQRYQEAINPAIKEEIHQPLPEINWEERKMLKNDLIAYYLRIFAYSFGGLFIFLVLPVMVAFPEVGTSMLMGMPPMLFVALSWIVGAWWAWDKDYYIFFAVTFGAVPMRIGVVLSWVMIFIGLPSINGPAFIFGMMLFWIVFTVIEIAMIRDFNNKCPRDRKEVIRESLF